MWYFVQSDNVYLHVHHVFFCFLETQNSYTQVLISLYKYRTNYVFKTYSPRYCPRVDKLKEVHYTKKGALLYMHNVAKGKHNTAHTSY